MKNVMTIASTLAALMVLGGCGHTVGDRAISGAGIGAGVGAVGAAVAGGSVATGAVVGAAVGAAAGAATDSDDVNLGRPVWKNHR